MIDPHVRLKMVTAITKYDERQKRSKHYNVWALGHYMDALHNVDEAVKDGEPLDSAIWRCFLDRLRDCVLKAAGFDPKTFDRFGRHITAKSN